MPISSTTPIDNHTGNSSTTVFPYNFYIPIEADISVYLDGVIQSSGFTISGVGNSTGGDVTFSSAPATDVVVRLERVTTIDRSTDYTTGGSLDANILDADIDRAIAISQEIDRRAFQEDSNGDLDADNRKLVNLSTPTLDTDAVTKLYADANIALINAGVTYTAEWANKAEDSLVSSNAGGDQVDDYSALHWAAKAATSASIFPSVAVGDAAKMLKVNAGGTAYEFSVGIVDDATTTAISIGSGGNVFFGESINLIDGKSLNLGTNYDLNIVHTGALGSIFNEVGSLHITQGSDGGALYLNTHNSSGVDTTNIRLGGSTPYVRLYYDGAEKLRTSNEGIDIGYGLSTEPAQLKIGNGRTGNGFSGIDLIGDATYTEYGLRFIRFNSGANSTSVITHRGAGQLVIQTEDSASISLWTNAAEKVRIDNTSTAGETALMLWDVDNNTLERVTVGAADSGGSGYKVLRIPN